VTTTIAITGASGFVGSALVDATRQDPQWACRAIYRRLPSVPLAGVQCFAVGDIEEGPDLSSALSGVDVVVHTAARAHRVVEDTSDPAEAYRRANVVATRVLLEAAIQARVRRFVFLSSVTVHGESTPPDKPFTEIDPPDPRTPYALSKLEAERTIWSVAERHPIEAVVLRPPLVYGPGVKGNMLRLIRLIKAGVPLPLGAVHNLRSMIGIENLVSAVLTAAVHPAAAGQTFLVSDQHDISTPDLIRILAAGLGRTPRLVPLPSALLALAGRLTGRSGEVRRLAQSLVIDSRLMTRTTQWRPAVEPRVAFLRLSQTLKRSVS